MALLGSRPCRFTFALLCCIYRRRSQMPGGAGKPSCNRAWRAGTRMNPLYYRPLPIQVDWPTLIYGLPVNGCEPDSGILVIQHPDLSGSERVIEEHLKGTLAPLRASRHPAGPWPRSRREWPSPFCPGHLSNEDGRAQPRRMATPLFHDSDYRQPPIPIVAVSTLFQTLLRTPRHRRKPDPCTLAERRCRSSSGKP
jgi:hypothetical protein